MSYPNIVPSVVLLTLGHGVQFFGNTAVTRNTIGCVEPYCSEVESWTNYIERMEQFFEANNISETKKKRAILLTSVGAKT